MTKHERVGTVEFTDGIRLSVSAKGVATPHVACYQLFKSMFEDPRYQNANRDEAPAWIIPIPLARCQQRHYSLGTIPLSPIWAPSKPTALLRRFTVPILILANLKLPTVPSGAKL